MPVPWVLLVVLGLNPVMIVCGDQLRAYGVGVLTEVAMLASLCVLMEEPTPKRALFTGTVALLCVQSLFANSVVLAAAGVAWGLICLWTGRWRALLHLAAVCGVAALSMLPYAYTFLHHREWMDIVQENLSLAFLWRRFLSTLRTSGPVTVYVWFALLAGAAVVCLWRLLTTKARGRDAKRELALWCLLTIVLGTVFHFGFVKCLRVSTAAAHRYYLPFLALTAFCIDVALGRLTGPAGWPSALRSAAGVTLAALAVLTCWDNTDVRMTTVDLQAAAVGKLADPKDLVIVWPAWTNLVFNRYYRGTAPWISLPDLDHRSFFLCPEFRDKMFKESAIEREVRLITDTLRAGHSVWLVGGLPRPAPGTVPDLSPGPSPRDPDRWNQFHYSTAWGGVVGALILEHCERVETVPILAASYRFAPDEYEPLLVAVGWR
jgi:hypothetical protein